VIDEDGNMLGVMTRAEALQAARDAELDLVEVSPEASPPVAKVVDWGKYNYQRTKQLQKNKKNAKNLELKQIKFGLKISDHDLGIKLKKVQEFLTEGHKVRLTAVYRCRDLAHRDIGYTLMDKAVNLLGEQAIVDSTPQFAGKQLSIVIRSNPSAKAKDA